MWRTGLRRPQAVWRGKSGAFCIFCVRCRYVIDACRCSIALGSQIKEKYFIPTQGNCSSENEYFVLNLTFTPTVWHATSIINTAPKWNIACLLFLLESNWSSNFQPSIFWCYLSSGQASKLIQIRWMSLFPGWAVQLLETYWMDSKKRLTSPQKGCQV